MKPITLSMQAFGPFAGREQVDFSRLPADALFLIHGPTGAGKTTLLDGICYALYGSTSGDERQAREMRSHHASDALQTEVELEFELGGQRYRVRRIPEQERAALRGKKDKVKVPASAELHRHDGSDWVPLASKTNEVSQKVEQLLGFKADQFRQVIMLPQGQFRKLLTAETREREKIMETLFATDKYRRLQERLQESARSLERRAGEEHGRRQTLLDHAGAETEEALTASMRDMELTLAALEPQLEQAVAAAGMAVKALSEGEALAARFQELELAQQTLRLLQEKSASVLTERMRLDRADKAQKIEPSWSVLNAASARRDRQRQMADAAKTEAGKAAENYHGAEAILAEQTGKESQREAARRDVMRLETLSDSVARLEQAQLARRKAAAERADADARLEKLTQQSNKMLERRHELAAEIERLTPIAAGMESARQEVENLERMMQMVEKIGSAQLALSQATAAISPAAVKFADAQTRLGVARDRRTELEEAWRKGQAAVLARRLSGGVPCPVCGSHEHPHPASQTEDIPSEEELKAAAADVLTAERECEAAREVFRHMENQRNMASTALSTLQGAFTGQDWEIYLTPNRRSAHLAEASSKLQQATAATQHLTQARAQHLEQETIIRDAENALAAARSGAVNANHAAAAAEAAYGTLAVSVPEELRTKAALEAAINKARASLSELEQTYKSAQQAFELAVAARAAANAARDVELKSLQEAEKSAAEAQAGFDEVLSHSAFADATAFLAARLAPQERERIDLLVREHEQAVADASGRLARSQEAAANLQEPDMDALRSALQAAQDARDALVMQQGAITQRLDDARKTATLLNEIRIRLDAIDREYRVLGELAAVAAGKNGANLAFQRYVLVALLDDVLRQASLRLKLMSRSRYALQRSSGVTDGRRAAGLDLEVLDDYTGRTRPANTLSGGEGFMASLALALGLSDTVQAYAGGIKLDTLFIDEGFGTLDPEALDLAMKTLIDLQQKGRMVGIISHVEDLKRQIESGIEIRFGPGGSTIRLGSPARGEA